MTGTIAGLGGMIECLLYALAGLGLLRRWGFTLAEAAALAALVPAMLMSFLLQVAALTGVLDQIPYLLAALGAAASVCIWRNRGVIAALGRQVMRFGREHPVAAAGLSLALGFLFFAAVFPAASAGGTGWRGFGSSSPGEIFHMDEALAPLNAMVLTRIFAEGPGAGLFAWLAYLSICFATYALSRRYAWPPTAISVTLLVVSMPRLVFQAVSSGAEIVPTAAALLFILMLYRTVERPDIKDALIMLLTLAFGISGGRMCLVFPAVGLELSAVVLYRRHGGRIWWDLVRQAPLAVAAALVPLFIFSQVWLFGLNVRAGKSWVGTPSGDQWVYNADGPAGFAGNLIRYGLQILDLTPPMERMLARGLGFDWGAGLQWCHDRLMPAALAGRGLAEPFVVRGPPRPDLAWFGPFAALLMVPALGWAFARGPRRLKALALALGAYFLLPWRMTRGRRRFLQAAAIALLAYGVGAIYMRL